MSTATDKQINFIKILGSEAREATNGSDQRNEILDIVAKGMKRELDAGEFTKQKASELIESLKELKANWRREDRSAHSVSTGDGTEPEPGMYKLADGTIIRVYLGQQSGKMLAKRLVGTPNGEHSHAYEYMGKAPRFIKSDTARLSLAEAQEFGRMTGTCCVCARRLDVPESVEAGIGPVCGRRMTEGFSR